MDLNKTINFTCEKFDEFERDIGNNRTIESITIESLKGSLDRKQQYSRRN